MTHIPVHTSRHPYVGLTVLGLGASLPTMDIAVNVAFPAITNAFDLDTRGIRWMVVYYVVTYACLMLAFGRLGDTLGHRRIFRAGLWVAAVGYLGCALAATYPVLLWARVVQGVSTAMLLSVAPALATQLFSESKRTQALGLHTATTSFSATLAPVIGGASIAWMDWSGVFWMRVPIIAIALACLRWLPDRDHPTRHSDHTGPTLLAASIACLLLAPSTLGTDGSTTFSILFLVAGLGLILGFAQQQRGSTTPFFAHLRTTRTDFVLHNLANVLLHFTAFAVPLVVPYYLANAAAYGPTGIGIALALSPIGMLLGSACAPFTAHRIGLRRCAVVAVLCLGLGTFAIALGARATHIEPVLCALLVNGFGMGMLQVVYSDVIVATLPREARGVAGGLTMLTRTIGVVVAASVLTAAFSLLEAARTGAGMPSRTAFVESFAILFEALAVMPMIVLAAIVARASLFRPPR